MKRPPARLELIEATGVLEVDEDWVNGNYQPIPFHSVPTASADRVRRNGGPTPSPRPRVLPPPGVPRHARPSRRHVRQALRPQSQVSLASTICPRRNARPSNGIVHRYRRLGAVLLDPDVSDDEFRVDCCPPCRMRRLREDQFDLARPSCAQPNPRRQPCCSRWLRWTAPPMDSQGPAGVGARCQRFGYNTTSSHPRSTPRHGPAEHGTILGPTGDDHKCLGSTLTSTVPVS